jgi:SET domain-containing protein
MHFTAIEDNAPSTHIKESCVEGVGLYASKDFKEGDLILDYNLFSSSWYKATYAELPEEHISKNWCIMLDTSLCLTTDKVSKFSFINHSRTPNCDWVVRDRVILANRKIFKDEELFIDYRMAPNFPGVPVPDWI